MIDLHKLARETWAMANSRRDKTGRAQDAVDTILSVLERVREEAFEEGKSASRKEQIETYLPMVKKEIAERVRDLGVIDALISAHNATLPSAEEQPQLGPLRPEYQTPILPILATAAPTAERKLLDEICDTLGCPHDAEALLKAVRSVGVRGDLQKAIETALHYGTSHGTGQLDRPTAGHLEDAGTLRGEIWTVKKSDLRGGRSGLFIGLSKVPLIQGASHKLQPVADAHNATLTRDEC